MTEMNYWMNLKGISKNESKPEYYGDCERRTEREQKSPERREIV